MRLRSHKPSLLGALPSESGSQAGTTLCMKHLYSPDLRGVIDAVARCIVAHADELSELDRAIGDGDHGVNMKRGSEAVLAGLERLSGLPPSATMRLIGTILVTTIGGASGPLFGTFFLHFGNALAILGSGEGVADAFSVAVRAVEARGRSQAGEKTMLDVLVPVEQALRDHRGKPDLLSRLHRVAGEAADDTKAMAASKGRAAYLGARSIGHMDPGARSSCLIIETACRTLEECC